MVAHMCVTRRSFLVAAQLNLTLLPARCRAWSSTSAHTAPFPMHATILCLPGAEKGFTPHRQQRLARQHLSVCICHALGPRMVRFLTLS